MKPQLLKISKSPAQSFTVRHDLKPGMNNKFHYHPEAELIYFIKGKGAQFIGDSISEFKSGDLVLVGANLPHYWRFDEDFTTIDPENYADFKVVHFSEKFLGEYFLNMPENKLIKDILDKAKRGIRIEGANKKKVTQMLDYMLETEGTDRIIYMIQALQEIAKCDQSEFLSSIGYSPAKEEMNNDRIQDIYDYTFANFRNRIELKEIADVARISPNSFCRYFKSFTQKTYSQFLTEIKVGQACKLLIDNRLNIKQICYESGFNNFTSFHKCFKGITGKSPLSYQREFMTS